MGIPALVERCLQECGVPNKLLDDPPDLSRHLGADGQVKLPKPRTREEWLEMEGIAVPGGAWKGLGAEASAGGP